MKSKTEKSASKTSSPFDKYDSTTYQSLDNQSGLNRSNKEKKSDSSPANIAWVLGKIYNLGECLI